MAKVSRSADSVLFQDPTRQTVGDSFTHKRWSGVVMLGGCSALPAKIESCHHHPHHNVPPIESSGVGTVTSYWHRTIDLGCQPRRFHPSIYSLSSLPFSGGCWGWDPQPRILRVPQSGPVAPGVSLRRRRPSALLAYWAMLMKRKALPTRYPATPSGLGPPASRCRRHPCRSRFCTHHEFLVLGRIVDCQGAKTLRMDKPMMNRLMLR